MKNFVKRGHSLNYLNDTGDTIASGDIVIIGKLAGVAETDILDGEVGAVLVEGVFSLTKAAGFAITQGDQLYYNISTGITKTVTDSLIGIAFEDALSAETIVSVKLLAGGDGGPVAEVVPALTNNSGGVTADGTIAVVTAPAALIDNSGGAATTTLALVATGTPASLAAQGAINGVIADGLASLAALQTVDRAAIVALTNAITELATKQNSVLTALKNAGLMASA